MNRDDSPAGLPRAAGPELVQRARAFAEAAHGAINHRRKHTDEPYTAHLARVADAVARVTTDAETIAAAWLHDVVEDTPTTLEDVARVFGTGVAKLVAAMTDVDYAAGNRRQRKALDRARLASADPRAQTIKYADILDNAPDLSAHDPHFARVYVRECAALINVMPAGDAGLRAAAEQALRDCRRRLARRSGDDGR